jgi:hypothetical protein
MSLLGTIASRHRIELEDFLNLSSNNSDYVNTNVSQVYSNSLEVELKAVIDGKKEFRLSNRGAENGGNSGFDLYIDTLGNTSVLVYGRGTINLGTVTLNDNFRTFKFKVTGSFPCSAELYINDAITLNGSLFTQPVESTGIYYLSTQLNGSQTPTNFFDSQVVWLRINGTTFLFDESNGYTVESDQGDIGTGVTSNPLGLAYWNNSVWKKKAVGDDVPPVEPNYDGNIYLICGQSNADGAAQLADADPLYTGVIPNAKIWNEQFSQWNDLEAGVNGSASLLYGFIFSLAYQLNQHDPTTVNYFVMKSLGGTGMYDDWGVGLPFYNGSLNAFANANQTGLYYKKAIIWQQGEEDSKLLVNANNYEQDEADMIDGMKNSTGINTFISGKLGDIDTGVYVFFATVNTAKDNNLTNGHASATIDTLDLDLQTDGVHFTASAYEVLGGTRYFDLVKNI